ncbi:MAG: division/cell wall cluster transcriptional repressor MraZ [Chloroflexota bacterium]
MFLNQYQHSFDDKGRLTIPAKFRQLPEEGAYVVQGLDRNLMVLPPESFQILYDRIMGLSLTEPSARLLRRAILGNALHVNLDGAGRILLTPKLRDYAELKSEVVFVGQGDYFEIWSPELWQDQETQVNDAALNAQRFAALDIKTR